MWRIVLLPLLLFTISFCMGQTFQYSRGWTNGKRSQQNAITHHKDGNLMISDLMDLQDNGRKWEKCLVQLQNYGYNPYLLHLLAAYPSYVNPLLKAAASSENNNFLMGNHHQSGEFLDDLTAAVESNGGDYGKH